jgi:hypothetical protein
VAIVRNERILPVADLVTGVQQARAALVRVVGWDKGPNAPENQRGLTTGWFITPQLVVTVGFVFEQARRSSPDTHFTFEIGGDSGSPRVEPIIGTPELLGHDLLQRVADTPMLAVCRVAGGAEGHVLELCFDKRDVGDSIYLLQFPEGGPHAGISLGRIVSFEGSSVSYDANTLPGSSGGPVLDQSWRVVAVHILHDFEHHVNQGVTRAALVTALRGSSVWHEIAAYHRIADDDAAREQLRQESTAETERAVLDPILIQAALRTKFDPKGLPAGQVERLSELVADPSAEVWSLLPAERRNIIKAAESLEALRKHRSTTRTDEVADRVIDDILDGPPYKLDDLSEESLAWWIQAARWFEGVAPELPTPAQIAKKLERQLSRGRLDRLAGPRFRGRASELAAMEKWYRSERGPLALTGVGGIGKSALVARFASQLPPETMLLWLDFDRADLAPDDAVSVVNAVAEEAAAQIEGFEKVTIHKNDWKTAAKALGKSIKKGVGSGPAPLLVLDSFEVAQYTERYQELWPVLEEIAAAVPNLRLIVTGRAPIRDLKLNGRPAVSVHLKGLNPDDAREWLMEKNITHPAVLDRVIELADGVPLILHLALRFVEKGGRVEDLPADLPPAIVAGYLHDRILGRVNPAYREFATGALVLRRLTQPMVEPVLGNLDGLTLPKGEVASWFPEFAREVALVEPGEVMRVRPEVRSATLEWLERDRLPFVQTIDRRAADWYAKEVQMTAEPEIAAELVYHRLRLGDISGAEKAWRDGAGAFLTYAADEIRDPAARDWLSDRLGVATGLPPVRVWESDAAQRILSVRRRGLNRAASEILKERKDRSHASPLTFHEAFELRAAGKNKLALELLDQAGDAPGRIGRDRTVLRALLLAESGDVRGADQLLASLEAPDQSTDHPAGCPVVIQAARIRLALNIETEIDLLRRLRSADDWHTLGEVLSSVDVILPRLKLRLRSSRPTFEQTLDAVDLIRERRTIDLHQRLENERAATLPEEPAEARQRRSTLYSQWAASGAWTGEPATLADFHLAADLYEEIPSLAEFGWRRWWILAQTDFLAQALEFATTSPTPRAMSVLGTLALFTLRYGNLRFGTESSSLGEMVRSAPATRETLHISSERWQEAQRALRTGVDNGHDWSKYKTKAGSDGAVVLLGELLRYAPTGVAEYPVDTGPFLLSLVAPDPLEQLVGDLAAAR